MLDLNTLPREEGPPSESVLKRQKFAVFEKHCSQVMPTHLFVAVPYLQLIVQAQAHIPLQRRGRGNGASVHDAAKQGCLAV